MLGNKYTSSYMAIKEKDKIVIDLIFEVSDKIVKSESEIGLNLENKIVLSIAIRLNSEIYNTRYFGDTFETIV